MAGPALACGAVMVWGGPAAADGSWSRADTFRDCQVESELTVRDSGTIEVTTQLVGPQTPCIFEWVSVRVTYVDEDGHARTARAGAQEEVRFAFSAPGATDVRSFHSTTFSSSCTTIRGEVCTSPEFELSAK